MASGSIDAAIDAVKSVGRGVLGTIAANIRMIMPRREIIGPPVMPDSGRETCSTAATPAATTTSYASPSVTRSEEHTSELQSRLHLVCRLLLEKKKPHASEPPQPYAHRAH